MPLRNGYNVIPGADLTGADLSGADLTGLDLTDANLTNANLTEAVLVRVIFNNTNLSYADFTQAEFVEVKSQETETQLPANEVHEFDFSTSNLTGAIFNKIVAKGVRKYGHSSGEYYYFSTFNATFKLPDDYLYPVQAEDCRNTLHGTAHP